MPHIIVEYSADLESHGQIPGLLRSLHTTLTAQGMDEARIKTRGIPVPHAIVGTQGFEGSMIHTTLLLLEGRPVELKKDIGAKLVQAVNEHIAAHNLPGDCSRTLEIRDMNKETYFL